MQVWRRINAKTLDGTGKLQAISAQNHSHKPGVQAHNFWCKKNVQSNILLSGSTLLPRQSLNQTTTIIEIYIHTGLVENKYQTL